MPVMLMRRFTRLASASNIFCLTMSPCGACLNPQSARRTTMRCLEHARLFSMNLADTFAEELEHAMMYDDETKFLKSFFSIPGTSQRLFLVQPRASIFSKSARNQVHPLSNPQLQLEENIALVQSLPGWHVTDYKILNAISMKRGTLFGSGNFEALQEDVRSRRNISGVFIGIDLLNGEQIAEFTHAFGGLPVYDRYRIVLEIFQQHATSSEAKLQIELAKIPMIRSLLQTRDRNYEAFFGKDLMFSVESQGMNVDRVRNAIRVREAKLRKALVKLQLTRQTRRKYRTEFNIPSIAVVGYTNAGKTSLIRSLSRDERLMPRDYLFATLDVTCHPVQLPTSGIKAVYLDTIGFISDMPMSLMESFAAVLEEVVESTIIVHVRDISHPDRKYQKDTVLRQLKALHLSAEKLENIIEVCNKTDKLSSESAQNDDDIADDAVMLSLADGSGLDEIKSRIEENVMRQAGFRQVKFSLPANNNAELNWLYQNAYVQNISEHPRDADKLSVEVLLDLTTMKKYQAQFGKLRAKSAQSEVPAEAAADK